MSAWATVQQLSSRVRAIHPLLPGLPGPWLRSEESRWRLLHLEELPPLEEGDGIDPFGLGLEVPEFPQETADQSPGQQVEESGEVTVLDIMQEGVLPGTVEQRFEDEGEADPDQGEAVAGKEERGEETDNPHGDHTIEGSQRRPPFFHRYRPKVSEVSGSGRFYEVRCLTQARQDRPVGHSIADPPLPGLGGEGDIVPICQAKVEPLEDAPDKDRKGDHEEEGAGPVHDEGCTPHPIDQGVSCQDI